MMAQQMAQQTAQQMAQCVEEKRKLEQPNQRQVKKPRMSPLPNNELELVALPLIMEKPPTANRNGRKQAWASYDAYNHKGSRPTRQAIE
jgi:hypothetical protein